MNRSHRFLVILGLLLVIPIATVAREPDLDASLAAAVPITVWRVSPPGPVAGDPTPPDYPDHDWRRQELPWD